jgi:mycofactocin precursor
MKDMESITLAPTTLDRPVELVDEDYVEEEMLVEEISIDGMCGVY